MPRKNPFAGMTSRLTTMADITRTGKERVGKPQFTVGGSGHRAGRGAQTAATGGDKLAQNSGQVLGQGPGQLPPTSTQQ